MIYKIYIMEPKPEYLTECSFEDMLDTMDLLVYDEKGPQNIMIIERDVIRNMDTPFYSYTGNRLEYKMFKEVVLGESRRLKHE